MGSGTASNVKIINVQGNSTTTTQLLSILSTPVFLAVLPLSANHTCMSFISEFSNLLSLVHPTYSRTIITGDFNLHIDNKSDPIFKPLKLPGFYTTCFIAYSPRT